MARFPGAIWRPITADKDRQRLTVYNRMNVHIAVSEASSLYGYFNQRGIPDSHFYVRRDGSCEQYVDTGMRAFADLEGNDATISVENQGDGTEPLTAAQEETNARLFAWAVKTHGIARKMATSSKTGTPSQGLSWHRLGCDGNFPSLPSVLAGRVQRGGGMRYSKSLGKGCPGDDPIRQVEDIFDRATELLDPTPSPAEEEAQAGFHKRWAVRYTQVSTEPGAGEIVTSVSTGDELFIRDNTGTEVDGVWYVETTAGNWVRNDHTALSRPFHTREVVEETHVYENPGLGMTDRLLIVGTRITVWDGSGIEVNDVWFVGTTSDNWVRSAKTRVV